MYSEYVFIEFSIFYFTPMCWCEAESYDVFRSAVFAGRSQTTIAFLFCINLLTCTRVLARHRVREFATGFPVTFFVTNRMRSRDTRRRHQSRTVPPYTSFDMFASVCVQSCARTLFVHIIRASIRQSLAHGFQRHCRTRDRTK